jgi:lipid A 4'-phosphatase
VAGAAHHQASFHEGIVLAGVAAAVAVLFAVTPLDLSAARLFYRPGEGNPWPLAHRLPWSVLYDAAPWVTASLLLTGLATLGAALLRRQGNLLRSGVFLLLSVVIGPGVVVNFVLKDHMGRPRPRDVIEFAGPSPYVPPFVPSNEGGASFPCGHCSVGFLFAAGWWIWRRRQPAWAWGSLAVGLASGFALGLARMAAGGHFLSDIVWAGLLALGFSHVLHDHVLRVLDIETAVEHVAYDSARRRLFRRALVAGAVVAGLVVLIVLFVTPHGSSLAARIPLPSDARPPWAFEASARRANVDVVLVDDGPEITVEGELHGFGLPTSTLRTEVERLDADLPTVRYRIVQKGWFTDLDGSARIRVPVSGLQRVSVHVDRGNIRVVDQAPGAAGTGRPVLDLHTGNGRVSRAPGREP